ncbi:MAG: choice-of-anchor L domain-containing protein [Phycisphaeraceae bacterium]|nr:choice-of-anchor L domain-containing protein [Phycisphaeraceae bacterium]
MRSRMLAAVAVMAWGSSVFAASLGVTTGYSATDLANAIVGSGVTVSNVSYTGAAGASGIFTGGAAAGITIDKGIILASGSVLNAIGPNNQGGATTDFGAAGDGDLNALVSYETHDAVVLEFDFTTSTQNLYFNYVFASEEYNEYSNTVFNDVFAFFLDGQNIALIPGTTTPVAINTINIGNIGGSGSPTPQNPEYFVDNSAAVEDIQYDGFTVPLTAKFLGLSEGTHHIKLAIADASDFVLDSAVFIQGGTFSGDETPITVPLPPAVLQGLMGALPLAGAFLARRKLFS